MVPFAKRKKFAGQQEYRFVARVIGEPKEKVFLMEITDALRKPGPAPNVRSNPRGGRPTG